MAATETKRLKELWESVNTVIWIYFVICFGALWTPDIPIMGNRLPVLISAVLGSSFGLVTDIVGKKISSFEPANSTEAKRVNEQIKSLAAMINAVAAGAVTVFALSQIAKGFGSLDMPMIMFALGIALYVHNGARALLGLLKDDSSLPQKALLGQEPEGGSNEALANALGSSSAA